MPVETAPNRHREAILSILNTEGPDIPNKALAERVGCHVGTVERAKRAWREAREKGEIRELPLEDIRLDGGTQMRPGLNPEQIGRIKELVEDGEEVDPVLVYFDGQWYWLAHGYHRWWGHKHAEAATIRCEVRQGTQRDAIIAGATANAKESVPRCPLTKRNAVLTLKADPEFAACSDREIARLTGVSRGLVYKINQLGERADPPPSDEEPEPDRPRGRAATNGHATNGTVREREPGEDDDLGDDDLEPFQAPAEGPKAGDRISDDDWLDGLPVRLDLSDRCRRIFDRSALAYREMKDHDGYKSFARWAGKLIDDKNIRGHAGPLVGRLRFLLRTPNPIDWKACRECRGTGLAGDVNECGKCRGAGFLIV